MPYFYNQYNTGQCYCSSAAPKASQYTYGASNLAGCEGDNYEIYALSGPANSLSFQGCYTGVTASLHPGNRFSSLEGCIKACSQSKSIMFSPNADTGAFDCKCDSRSSIGEMAADTTTCGQFTWFTYLNNQPKRRIEGKRRLDKQLVFDDDEEDCEGDEHETVHLVEEVKYVFVGEGCDDDEQSDAS
nr:uncharacterized protein I303_08298 [Kwoniella dejecticola CBS 10117]OBR81528.1 hypothetical protein I303_08298 [Kwoniella dejecticola CBS 10117]